MRQAYRNVALAWAMAACLVACSRDHRAKTTSPPNRGPAALQSDDVENGERIEHPLGGSPPASGESSATDADGDGIDDATELALAQKYFPYYTVDSRDRCSRHGVLFRLTRHPDDESKIAIWYVVLYERDCGLFGIGAHVGDDEVFGEIVDPKRPAPEGILAIRAIAHQNTTCEHVSTCGALSNCAPCATAEKAGQRYPVVFSSRNKHGSYVSEAACNKWLCGLAGCRLDGQPDNPPFVNAGEPGKPLTRDLTSKGFVTRANGWTEPAIMNFDPWGNRKFGGAGNVTDDLTDKSFLIAPTGCGV